MFSEQILVELGEFNVQYANRGRLIEAIFALQSSPSVWDC